MTNQQIIFNEAVEFMKNGKIGKTGRQFEVEDENGNIQYLNIQNGGTTEGNYDYEFVLDEQGHNQNNLTFTEEEQATYGLSNMDDYYNSMDLETFMNSVARKRIQELTEINMRLVTEKMAKEKENA